MHNDLIATTTGHKLSIDRCVHRIDRLEVTRHWLPGDGHRQTIIAWNSPCIDPLLYELNFGGRQGFSPAELSLGGMAESSVATMRLSNSLSALLPG